MRRAYKFRLRPTAKQHDRLRACLNYHRDLYNAALQERRDAYERVVRRSPEYYGDKRPKMPVNYYTQQAQLPEIRAMLGDLAVGGSASEQGTLRQLDKAFANCFRRIKTGKTPGYPRFKSAHRFNSVEWPKYGNGCKWDADNGRVYLKDIGRHVRVTVHRPVEGDIKTIRVKREGRHWYIIFSCDNVSEKPLPAVEAAVGLDMGIASFLTTSDGEHIQNPRYGAVAADRLTRAQQILARKKRGSNNRKKARETVARRHHKVSNQRRDFHHKTARKLVKQYDSIVIEDLKVKNMTKSAKGTKETPGKNVAAKSGLNRSINDAGWAQFISILDAKAEEAGRRMIRVNPQYTSQMCAECGHVDKGNRVSQAVFRCLICGHEAHADENAAKVIMSRAGLAHLTAQAV